MNLSFPMLFAGSRRLLRLLFSTTAGSRRLTRLSLASWGAWLLVACSGGSGSDSNYVPRPHAYPRITITTPSYSPADSVPTIDFNFNSAAASLIPKSNGCDIIYNNYGATIYLSVISNLDSPDKFNSAWQNRIERIDRNLAGASKNTTPVKNKNFDALVIITPTVTQTPVQLLAANTQKGIIVSATAFMLNNIPTSAYDSIAPIYNAIAEDITNLALSLRCK